MLETQETWVCPWVRKRSPGGGHGHPLQYSCLQDPLDRGAWRAAAFPGGSDGEESACNVGELGREDPLEEGMAACSDDLAWRLPWTEEPGGLQSRGSQRGGPGRVIRAARGVRLFQNAIHKPRSGARKTILSCLMLPLFLTPSLGKQFNG